MFRVMEFSVSEVEQLKLDLIKERMLLRYVLREFNVEYSEETLIKLRYEIDNSVNQKGAYYEV